MVTARGVYQIIPTTTQGHAMSTASPAPSRAAMQQLLVPTGAAVIAVLLARCADKAPAVRAKALAALGHWLQGWVSHPAGMASRDLARCLHLASEMRLDELGPRAGMQATPGAAVATVRQCIACLSTAPIPHAAQGGATPASAGPLRHCFVVDSQAVVAPTSVVRPDPQCCRPHTLHHAHLTMPTLCAQPCALQPPHRCHRHTVAIATPLQLLYRCHRST